MHVAACGSPCARGGRRHPNLRRGLQVVKVSSHPISIVVVRAGGEVCSRRSHLTLQLRQLAMVHGGVASGSEGANLPSRSRCGVETDASIVCDRWMCLNDRFLNSVLLSDLWAPLTIGLL